MASELTSADSHHRLCPSCGRSNPPQTLRCACGALLSGVDLVRKEEAPAVVAPPSDVVSASTTRCPHEDCGQENPAGSEVCLYCNRPLQGEVLEDQPLFQLPPALAERYRLLRSLPSQGAEAELFVLETQQEARVVVLKLYRSGILPKPEIQARLKQINPRSCVQVFESGVSAGHAYEIMEWCAGGSLRERMRAGPIPATEVETIAAELVEALADTHALGIVHRDLKPENILVRSDTPLDLVLTDFGIASVLEATQCFTGMARTLLYSAPESLAGVLDAKADYWSLGMILLECALGTHPFAGLSDSVVLHALCTRSVDLAAVADVRLRTLLRGLLLRDPKQRWGQAELVRWLAHDATLREPVEHGTFVGAHTYRLGADVCHTPEQLAIALARHWQDGVSDILNGQLQAWFRDTQKDHNTVRILIQNKHENPLPPDQQLLRLILHLAPGIPPVWRGESVEPRAILRQAALALKGDQAAAQWLVDLHQSRVTQVYAQAGNLELAELSERWMRAFDGFAEQWRAKAEGLHAWVREQCGKTGLDVGTALYGRGEVQAPILPELLPRLLAIAYDRNWAARLRQRILHALERLSITLPGCVEYANVSAESHEGLLVIDALLPEMRRVAERIESAQAAARVQQTEALNALQLDATANLARLRRHDDHFVVSMRLCEDLRQDLDEFDAILARIRALGSSEEKAQDLRKRLSRIEPITHRLRQHIDRFDERELVTDAWRSPQMLSAVVMLFIVLPSALGRRMFFVMIGLTLGVFGWRVLPYYLSMRQIKGLIRQI